MKPRSSYLVAEVASAFNTKDCPTEEIFPRGSLLDNRSSDRPGVPQNTGLAAVVLISWTISLRRSENSRGRKAGAPRQSVPTLRTGTHQQPTSTGRA